jgi:hypothetical protein
MTAPHSTATSPGASRVAKILYLSQLGYYSYPEPVEFFNYKTDKQLGTLTDFRVPMGQCVDKHGDVWITDEDEESVQEYAHDGAGPLKTLDTDGQAQGCSVDPTTGNLAVADRYSFHDGKEGDGDIFVFKNASGTPTVYTNSYCNVYSSPGYDNNGNLYVAAEYEQKGTGVVCELPAGASAMRNVTVSVTIGNPGTVMWDGKYITLADLYYEGGPTTAIYQMTEQPSSGNLTVVGTTVLQDDDCGSGWTIVGQPYIVGKKNTPANKQQGTLLIGDNSYCEDHPFDFWAYPAGGNPIKQVLGIGWQGVQGESVSFSK